MNPKLRAVGPVAAMTLLAGLAATPAAAQTEVFFSEYIFQGARMMAVKPDGTGARQLFMLPPDQWLPLGITYIPSAGRMLWMDSAGDSELRTSALDGSSPAIVTAVPGFARGASRDAAGRIFYSSNNELHRVNPDGSGMTVIHVAENVLGMPRVDATNSHVYIGADESIIRMDLDGTNVKTVVRGISQARNIGLDIARGYVYWADGDTHTDFIGRARLDDTNYEVIVDLSPLVGQSSGLADILVDPASSSVFYTDELATKLYKSGLAGESPTVIYTSPATGLAPLGITLSTGEPDQAMQDCDGNGIADDVDIAGGAPDCDNNGVIDTCQVNPCPTRNLLLDNGSKAEDFNGRAIGVPSQWQVFQPFIVPAGGWKIGEIAIDGYNVERADGSGITAKIYPDDGTSQRPNETGSALGTAVLQMRHSTNFENWVYAPMDATLTPGQYWVRLEANQPTVYWGSINLGDGGMQSRSRGASGTFTSFASPIALRLIEKVCVVDLNGDGVVDFGDYLEFLNLFDALDPRVDFNHDGVIDFGDYLEFLNLFDAGC